ncbi:MAG: FHA domain-containing protein [Myxococcaceae bacterium]|nr:FHA domain-containing protein [Myxococcaceae bacterium]
MRCWLERLSPPGDDYELPEGRASLVFGRSPKATLVFDDALLSARHCELFSDGTFWRVKDLGTENGTRVNGREIRYPRALFDEDRLQFGRIELRFRSEVRADDPVLKEAISREPDAPEPWLVYADWLLERGDPLGERMAQARANGRLDHAPWLGPLWDRLLTGELEIDWQLGMVRRATFRQAVGQLPYDWHDAVSTLLRTRVAQFLRELVIDLPRLHQGARALDVEDLVDAQRFLGTLPLPSTLERVSLGYRLGDRSQRLACIEELAQRAPRVRGQDVFVSVRQARLKLLSIVDGVRFIGVSEGFRPLTAVTRVRRGTKNQLHFESPPGIPFIADGNPCHFAPGDGTWKLFAGRLRGEVRVNQRVDSVYQLLPGDVIEVQGAGKLRFEVQP